MEFNDNERRALYLEAKCTFGLYHQMMKAIEELGELTVVLSRMQDDRCTIQDLITEMADVNIMLEQLETFFGAHYLVWQEKQRKLERLKNRIEQIKNNQPMEE